MRAEAFIIHLARAEKRRPQVERLAAALPLEAHVVDAVDGLKLGAGEIGEVYRPHLARPRYPFALLATEVGCFLSHRRTWRRIVDSGLDAGLIVEDDVALDAKLFPAALALALREARPSDYVRFPFRAYTDKGETIASEGDVRLVRPRPVGLGMQAQLVGREAAAALLEQTRQFDRPVDTTLQLDRIAGVRMLAVRPVSIRTEHEALGGTVVQKKGGKGLPAILSREVKRATYRLKVRLLAAR